MQTRATTYKRPSKRRTPNADRYHLEYDLIPQSGPYLLVAVDPGLTTGMAFRCGDLLKTCVAQSAIEVLEMLEGAHRVVIERFVTGGTLSTYGLQTIELVGTVKGWCAAKGIDCRVVTPAARKMCQSKANNMVGTVIQKHALCIHECDAMAHLLAFEERNPDLAERNLHLGR